MRLAQGLLAIAFFVLSAAVAPSGAGEPAKKKIAVFDFSLVDTSLNGDNQAQDARLMSVTSVAREAFAARGYEVIDVSSVPEATQASLRGCNGCEVDLAAKLGADEVALGWVQKVSNLILNINLQVRDVATGQLVKHGSTDIRGNTDQSWSHGIRYLMKNRILSS